MSTANQVFHRNRSLFVFLIGLLICFILIILLWQPLLPFMLGLLIAFIFMPVIDWLDRRLPFRKKGHVAQRLTIIIVVFIAVLAILYAVAYFTFSGMRSAFASLPGTIMSGMEDLGDWFDSVVVTFSPDLQKQVRDTVENVGNSVGGWMQQSFTSGISILVSTFTFILGFFTLPFFLVFYMTSAHEIGTEFKSAFSIGVGYHVSNFLKMMEEIFGKYFRAQLITALVIAVLVTVVLEIMGIELAPALGLIAGVFQLIPTIGGLIAAIIGILVTLAVAPDKILWVIIVYVIINLVVSSALTARLSGQAVNMRSAIVLVLIVVGGYIAGIYGMILIVPIVAMAVALYKYSMHEIEKTEIANETTPPD